MAALRAHNEFPPLTVPQIRHNESTNDLLLSSTYVEVLVNLCGIFPSSPDPIASQVYSLTAPILTLWPQLSESTTASNFSATTMASLNPFLLAANTPDPDPRLLPLLRTRPELAAAQDVHGYSLLHAAASYNHVELLRSLVNEFRVDVNLKDEDGETCLFVAETVEVAQCLVHELHIDLRIRNEDGMDALEKFESEQEFPEVADYLRARTSDGSMEGGAGAPTTPNGVHNPPALPPNVSINIGTGPDASGALDQEADPEFQRRIEELASGDNFHSAEGQRELRDLITDAVRE